MKVLIDSNIALDALLNNVGFVDNSKKIFDLAYKKRFTGYISASAVTDIFYISSKKLGKKAAKEAIKYLLQIYYPATVTDGDIYKALDLTWDDFEDSVQFTVGEGLSADYIVTRNTQDYNLSLRRVSDDVNRMAPRSGDNSPSHIPVVTPEQFIKIIAGIEQEPH